MNAMNNDRELKNRPSSRDGRFRKPLSRWTRSHPRLWGWSTAILSIALPILAIVCGLRWGELAAFLSAARPLGDHLARNHREGIGTRRHRTREGRAHQSNDPS